jgi:hypothetical protein
MELHQELQIPKKKMTELREDKNKERIDQQLSRQVICSTQLLQEKQ